MTVAENVVIVGASLAGLRTAEALREGGYEGGLTLIGDERHVPYDRPPLSKQVLAGWVGPLDTALPRLCDTRATWRLGVAATGLDRAARRVALADGSSIAYDRLVIATGTRARAWPIAAEATLRGVHCLRTPEDAAAIVAALDVRPSRVLVIGAGFTGSEVASACRDRDLPVTVVERLAAPLLMAFGETIGGFIAGRQRAAGVDLRCGVQVIGLEHDGSGAVAGARLSDGDTVTAELVVPCLGAVRNSEWLHDSGLDAGPQGCACDASCSALDTAGARVPDIYVCGDIARFRHPLSAGRLVALEHWGGALDQAQIVAANLLRPGSASNDDSLPRFWSSQFGIGFKASGLPACGDEMMIVQGSLVTGRFIAAYGRGGRMVGVVAANQARWIGFYEQQIATGGAFPPGYRVVDAPAGAKPCAANFPPIPALALS